MHNRAPQSLTWSDVLNALRTCSGEVVLIRDGKVTEPAESVRNRPSAKGTELCLFAGAEPARRLELIEQLQALSQTSGRRFMTSARARIGESSLLVAAVADEEVDGRPSAIVSTRRPKLGFNQSQQTGASTTLRSKRIKTT